MNKRQINENLKYTNKGTKIKNQLYNKIKFISKNKKIDESVNSKKNSLSKNFIKENINNVSQISNNMNKIKVNIINNIRKKSFNSLLKKNSYSSFSRKNTVINNSYINKKDYLINKTKSKEKTNLFSNYFIGGDLKNINNKQSLILNKKLSYQNILNKKKNLNNIKTKEKSIKNNKKLEIIKLIMEAQNHSIYLVKNTISNKEYILKKFPKKLNNKFYKILRIKNEAKILRNLNHPNVAKLYKFKESRNSFKIYIEKANGLNLSEFLKSKEYKSYDKEFCINIMKQIFIAINYLHSSNIAHLDIKLENIVYDNKNKSLVIIDFGFSIKYNNEDISVSNGTPYYVSPELIINRKVKPYTCDIWACGIVFHKIYTNRYPFIGDNEKELYKNIINKKYLPIKKMDINTKLLLKQIFNKDYKTRIRIKEILRMTLFN